MSEEVRITRISRGATSAPRMDHGIEVVFEALPAAWGDGHQVDIVFPDGSVVLIEGEPEAGPTSFSWVRGPSERWFIRLEPIRPNVLVVCFEDHHRDIIARGL